jgi:SAM-dependent methyltransferase
LRNALRLLFCPVDLWRYHEFGAVLAAYAGETPVLDVGSPKLIALLLAEQSGTPVFAADIVPRVGAECAFLQRSARRGRIHPLVFDARAIPFADGSLPFISCVSAIEHIGGDGDSEAVREIARVLKPGGTVVLTTPLVPAYREQWTGTDPYGKQARDGAGRVFFSRYYDWASFTDRILQCSGLRLVAVHAWQEASQGWYCRYCRWTARPASLRAVLVKLFDPYWAFSRIRAVPEGPARITGHGLLAAVLRKADGQI